MAAIVGGYGAPNLEPVSVTAAGTTAILVGQMAVCDSTLGAQQIDFPTSASTGDRVGVKLKTGANKVTINGGGVILVELFGFQGNYFTSTSLGVVGDTAIYFYDGASWSLEETYLGQIACYVSNTTDIALASGTNVLLTFDTESYDTASMHSNATNPERLTAPVTGVYELNCQCRISTGGVATNLNVFFRKNGFNLQFNNSYVTGGGAGVFWTKCATWIGKLNAGDYITVYAFQSSGAARVVQGTIADPLLGLQASMTLLNRG